MEICIDFDGTCVTHEFPLVGKDIGAAEVLRKLVNAGHKLILFTMRSDCWEIGNKSKETPLSDAINWFKENKIPLYCVNVNPTQHTWTNSPKAYGQLYIDDAALGCPLKFDDSISNRPFVDWKEVERLLRDVYKLID